MDSYIIAAAGLVLSVLTYFAGQKRTSNADVEKRARFEGEVNATLKSMKASLDSLQEKFDKFSDGYNEEIDRRIREHEARYHGT